MVLLQAQNTGLYPYVFSKAKESIEGSDFYDIYFGGMFYPNLLTSSLKPKFEKCDFFCRLRLTHYPHSLTDNVMFSCLGHISVVVDQFAVLPPRI